jgi:hypothetical protein
MSNILFFNRVVRTMNVFEELLQQADRGLHYRPSDAVRARRWIASTATNSQLEFTIAELPS